MARWKLMTGHYLNVPGNEWEYTETNQQTQRPQRMKLSVPKLLDPRDPDCWTRRWGSGITADGEIVVCHEGKGESGDQVFFGSPTPDMVPLDAEAEEISASFANAWRYKVDSGKDYSQSMIDDLEAQMKNIKPAPMEVPGLADLTAAIGQLVQQNQAALAASAPARRV